MADGEEARAEKSSFPRDSHRGFAEFLFMKCRLLAMARRLEEEGKKAARPSRNNVLKECKSQKKVGAAAYRFADHFLCKGRMSANGECMLKWPTGAVASERRLDSYISRTTVLGHVEE